MPTTTKRVAIVTGANAGVGRETALALASPAHDFHVVLACRSKKLGELTRDYIRSSHPDASVAFMPLDLSSFDSICAFSESVCAELGAVSVLVLNAGIGGMGGTPASVSDEATADLTYRTNFIGHFLLTLQLLEPLQKGAAKHAPSRVVCLSSVMHRHGSATDWLAPINYSKSQRTYATSKLAMAVLSSEVTRRWADKNIIGIAVNPGAVNSDIWYRGQQPHFVQEYLVRPAFSLLFLTSAQGAACSIAAATDERYSTPVIGRYLCPYRTPNLTPWPFELHGPFAGARECRPVNAVLDEATGRRLWEQTLTYLRERLPERRIE